MGELGKAANEPEDQSDQRVPDDLAGAIPWNSCHEAIRGGVRRLQVEECAAPRTPVEEVVADIWAEVLQVPRVGVRDNFFDLGGHSLIGMQIVVRVCETMQADVSLHDLFDAPTVEEFSARVVAKELKPGQVGRIADFIKILRDGRGDVFQQETPRLKT
jgi:acyl carrier protein